MRKLPRRRCGAVLAACWCAIAWTCAVRAEDPGELFPSVPYGDTVSTPIREPERSVELRPKPPQPPEPPRIVVKPVPEPAPQPAPAPTPPTSAPAPAEPAVAFVKFAPYAADLMSPLLSPEDRNTFTAKYAEMISKALAGSIDQRKRTADLVEAAAQEVASPDLQRYLLLHAFGLYIRAGTSPALRTQKVQKLLPLLTGHSLPVVQARADALDDLMLTTISNPNERFVDWYIDAQATLAKLQVQAGFPKEAQESIKKARDALAHYQRKSAARIDQVNEAAAWCERAATAAALWPRFQEMLKTTPDDAFTNNMMATLHLSLYGNLQHAAPFAARSDRKDLRTLAEVVKANPPGNLSSDPAIHANQALTIARALVDVAKASPVAQRFDRYAIACYAGDRVAAMVAGGQVPPEKREEALALLAEAREIIDKTDLKRGDDLPRWLQSETTAGGTSGTAPAAQALASLGDILHAIPRDLLPAESAWNAKQIDAINAWLASNLVGQTFKGTALFDRVDQSTEGPGGKIFVPVIFELPYAEIKTDLGVRASLEDRMMVAQAAGARRLVYQKETAVKGTITAATLAAADGARTARLHLVLANKAE